MKKIEWVFPVLLIASGLCCLSMAPLVMGRSFSGFIHSFFSVCIWTAVPLIIIGLAYLFYIKKMSE